MDTAMSKREQAFQDGIDACADGKKQSDCPFNAQAQRELFEAWMAGWQNEKKLRDALNTR